MLGSPSLDRTEFEKQEPQGTVQAATEVSSLESEGKSALRLGSGVG